MADFAGGSLVKHSDFKLKAVARGRLKYGENMVEIYNDGDYAVVKKQKKIFLTVFFVTLAALLAVNIAVFVFYTRQEYKTPLKTPLIAFCIITCSVYAIIYYILFAIKFKRINSYMRMLDYFKKGLSEQGRHAFVRVDSSVTEKDGVRFLPLVFLEWSDKEQDYFERNILFDVEKPVPEFKKGQMILHKTQGNILVAYELFDDGIFD